MLLEKTYDHDENNLNISQNITEKQIQTQNLKFFISILNFQMSDVVAALKLSSDQTTSNVNPPGTVSALEADQSALDVEPGKAYFFYKCIKI